MIVKISNHLAGVNHVMKLEELDIWGKSPPPPWVRTAADRWAQLVERAAILFMGLYVASPLSRTETELLILLWKEPESGEPAMLAERLHVSRQTMTGLLDKLETSGYIERTAHPTDRRRKVLRLKKKGVNLVRDFAGSVLRREAQFFEQHPAGEIQSTLDTLDRLVSMAEQWNRDHPLDGPAAAK